MMKSLLHTSLPGIVWILMGAMSGTEAVAAELQPLENQVTRPEPKPAPRVNPVPKPAAPTPPPAQAAAKESKPRKSSDGMLFNFQDADVQAVIKTISQITGKNFVLDPRVKGKISIISAKPVSKTAAYQIFLSALKAQGFTTALVNRDTLKIIPVGEGKQNASLTSEDFSRGGEQMISQVVVIQHGSATELVPLLRPLMAPTSQLSAYAPANALIITDYADNLGRLLNLVNQIDQPMSTDVTIIPLHHASALDMADLIGRLTAQTGRPGVPAAAGAAVTAADGRTSIVPDLRTNSLLVRSDNPGRVVQIKELVAKLDVPAKTDGNTRVIYLRNADAKTLAEILRGLLEASTRQAARTSKGAPAAAGASSEAQSSLIQADEATNALIISASDAVYNNLRGVIDKLDTRRAQVFVEALIIEITTDKATQFGFQWAGAGTAGDGAVAGVTNFPNAGSIIDTTVNGGANLAGAGGLSVAYVGPEITLPDGSVVRGLGGLARALEEENLGNILSTPNILTLDNAEAKITVGQNVPFLTGSFTQASTGASNPFQTIERKDVGLTLKIKPQITEGGTIKLEIMSEVSSVARATLAAQDLITNKRTLETTVVVDDGSSVVLGGLIEDSVDQSTQQVPILGRIPILGWLFKYRSKQKKKTNLMVFLRPTIIRNPKDSLSISSDRYEYVVGQQTKSKIRKKKDRALLDQFSPRDNTSFGPSDSLKSEDQAVSDSSKNSADQELLGPPNIEETPELPSEPDSSTAQEPAVDAEPAEPR